MTMNSPGDYDPEITSAPSGPSSTDTKEKAQQAAGTAVDEARSVAGTAQSEARQVADEAKTQARGLLDQATTQVDDQARTQRDRLVGVLGSLGDDLENMSTQGGGGLASDLTRQAAERVHGLHRHLDGREPRALLDDVRDFARRRPGTFLIGALVTGVVAGRLTRGAKDAESSDGVSGTTTPSTYPSATPGVPASVQRSPVAESLPAEPLAPEERRSPVDVDADVAGLGGTPVSEPGPWTDQGLRGDRS